MRKLPSRVSHCCSPVQWRLKNCFPQSLWGTTLERVLFCFFRHINPTLGKAHTRHVEECWGLCTLDHRMSCQPGRKGRKTAMPPEEHRHVCSQEPTGGDVFIYFPYSGSSLSYKTKKTESSNYKPHCVAWKHPEVLFPFNHKISLKFRSRNKIQRNIKIGFKKLLFH